MNVPNLDCMEPDELMALWVQYRAHPVTVARELGISGKGAKRTVMDLSNYASNKATAIRCRLAGKISEALMYEGIADRIYKGLPDSVKW